MHTIARTSSHLLGQVLLVCPSVWQTLQVAVRFLSPNTKPESEAFILAPVPSGEAGAEFGAELVLWKDVQMMVLV